MLTQKHSDDLHDSALTDKMIAEYNIVSLTSEEVRQKLNRNDLDCGGWLIPYPDSSFFKIRLDRPLGDRKYLSLAGMSQDIFFTHAAKSCVNNTDTPFYFVEGEKKAICLEGLGYAALSVPGVWGWKSHGHSVDALSNINLKGRVCRIVFDSDKYSNKHVLKAEFELAKFLRRRGAIVEIVNLAPGLGKGVDDQVKSLIDAGNLEDLKRTFLESPKSYKDYIKEKKQEKPAASLYTDYWNAEKLVELFGKDFRWCQELKSWFVWDGKIWKKDPGGLRVERFAKKLTKEMMASEDKDLLKHAKASQNKHSLAAMVELAKSEDGVLIETADFDKDGFLLNCSNGTLDLRTGKISPHDPNNYMTKMVPVDYNPDAKCPTWEWFLNDIFDGNQNMIIFLKKAVGYALTDSTEEHCFFILYGIGRNGKNTFLDTIRELLAGYAGKTGVSTLMVKHNRDSGPNEDIADLWGKRLIAASESETSRTLSEGTIKELTGDKVIKARFLYGHLFEYVPTYKIFLMTNHKPKIKGTDEGIWSRPRLVPFTKIIPPEKRIKGLGDKLIKEELAGILRWTVEGCFLWQREGLGSTPEIDQATNEYRQEEDFIGSFLLESCILASHCQVSSTQLYEAFKVWAKSNGEFYIGQKEFTRYLESRGYKKAQRTFGAEKGRMFWERIGLLDGKSASTPVFENDPLPASFPSMEEEQ